MKQAAGNHKMMRRNEQGRLAGAKTGLVGRFKTTSVPGCKDARSRSGLN